MPIRLFAVGTGAFNFSSMNIDVGEMFDMADMASLSETLPSVRRTVARAATQEATTSNLERAMTGLAAGSYRSVWRGAATGLMDCSQSIVLSFSFRNEHWHQLHDTGHRQFTLNNRISNPAWHILERLRPALESAQMMNQGVLIAIATAFNQFVLHETHPGGSQNRNPDRPISYSGDRRLNIQMSC